MARYPTMGYLLRVKKILSSRIQIYLLYLLMCDKEVKEV